jgi:hypothetical protein
VLVLLAAVCAKRDDERASSQETGVADGSGKERAIWSTHSRAIWSTCSAFNFPYLAFFDDKGQVGQFLDPAAVALADDQGKRRAILYTGTEGPSLELLDGSSGSRAALHAWKDAARLELYDSSARFRAVLGSTSLQIPRTGTVEERPESSLILFDKDGKVIWRAP